jgi:hypothetical protein
MRGTAERYRTPGSFPCVGRRVLDHGRGHRCLGSRMNLKHGGGYRLSSRYAAYFRYPCETRHESVPQLSFTKVL